MSGGLEVHRTRDGGDDLQGGEELGACNISGTE